MKITDLMYLLIVFGVAMTGLAMFIGEAESQYGTSDYTSTFNENQYEYLVNEQAGLASDGATSAQSNTELGSSGTTTDPYQNIFVGGWNAVKDLLGVGSNIATLQAELEQTTGGSDVGFNIPGWAWAALASVVAIIIVSTLINASQRINV